jgi:outer membrane protein assembly factor BamB
MTMDDRDALIKLAISAPRTVEAPADLGDAIFRQIRVTKQERGLIRLGRLGFVPRLTPVFVAAVLLVLAALVAIAVGSRLQQRAHLLSEYHGGPDRTGIMVGPGPRGVPVAAWDVTRPGPLPFTTMPLVQDGRVFVADGSGTVAALDAATGRTLWEHATGSPARGAPAMLGDLFILGTDAGHVIALSTADGAPAWDQAIGSAPISASVLEADGRVYVGNADGTFVALDGRTGARLWTADVGGPVTRGAALADGVVYVGAKGGRFSALDATTGKDRWRVELGPGEVGTPVVGPGAVFVGRGLLAPDGPHDVLALDRADGAIRWAFAAPSGRQVFPGALANGFLYGVSDDGSIYALDPASGALRWTVKAAQGQLGTLGSIVGNALYVTTADRNVQAFDATTGAHLWSVDVVGVPTEAAVVDGSLFLGTSLGHVYALRDPALDATPGAVTSNSPSPR